MVVVGPVHSGRKRTWRGCKVNAKSSVVLGLDAGDDQRGVLQYPLRLAPDKVLQPLRPGVGRSRQRRRRLIGSIAAAWPPRTGRPSRCAGCCRPTWPLPWNGGHVSLVCAADGMADSDRSFVYGVVVLGCRHGDSLLVIPVGGGVGQQRRLRCCIRVRRVVDGHRHVARRLGIQFHRVATAETLCLVDDDMRIWLRLSRPVLSRLVPSHQQERNMSHIGREADQRRQGVRRRCRWDSAPSSQVLARSSSAGASLIPELGVQSISKTVTE